MYKKPKIVVIGGGTGLSIILRGLKHFPVDITAIVTVADDGGSSGKLRNELGIPAPGDIRNVFVALSEMEPLFEDLLQYRFKGQGELGGHPLGNLLLAAIVEMSGDLASGLSNLQEIFHIKGSIMPSTCDIATLMANHVDGSFTRGESQIPLSNKKIKKVFFEHEPKAFDGSVKAIEEADLIVLGIGSLYTSILPNIIIPEIKAALLKAKGKKVYICNAMEQPGETKGYSLCDHIDALNLHLGEDFLDVVIADKTPIASDVMDYYYKADGVKQVVVDYSTCMGYKFKLVEANLLEATTIKKDSCVTLIRHHPYKTAAAVYSLVDH